jgi:2'-5' RNA ligase
MRTFIAIALPEPSKRHVIAQQRQVQQHLREAGLPEVFRWTPPENLHLTLRFLGDTAVVQRQAVETALQRIAGATPAFDLAVQALGCFPNLRRPNILWLDLAGDVSRLAALQRQIEAAVQAAGFAAEDRAFSPHLTVARAQKSATTQEQQRAGDVLRRVIGLPPSAGEPFTVDSVHLVESELRPSGSVYTTLLTAGLQGQ